jgi:hypothetical protein
MGLASGTILILIIVGIAFIAKADGHEWRPDDQSHLS